MARSLMTRVVREAEMHPQQGGVLRFLRSKQKIIVAAAKAGEPPAAAVSALLLAEFGEQMRSPRLRQFSGLTVAALLEEAGYEIARTGVRLTDDPLFTVGTLFKKRTAGEPPENVETTLLDRFLDSLTEEELRYALARIRRRLRS